MTCRHSPAIRRFTFFSSLSRSSLLTGKSLLLMLAFYFFSVDIFSSIWFCAQSTLCRWRKYFSMFLISFHIYKYTITYRYFFPVELAFFFLNVECQHSIRSECLSNFIHFWVLLMKMEKLKFVFLIVRCHCDICCSADASDIFSQPLLLSSSTWKGWKLYSTTFLLARCDVNTRVAEQSQIMYVGGRWKQRSNDSFNFFSLYLKQ